MADYILLDGKGIVTGFMSGANREPHTSATTETYEAVDVEAVQALPPDARKAPYEALPKRLYQHQVEAECHSFVLREAGDTRPVIVGQTFPSP